MQQQRQIVSKYITNVEGPLGQGNYIKMEFPKNKLKVMRIVRPGDDIDLQQTSLILQSLLKYMRKNESFSWKDDNVFFDAIVFTLRTEFTSGNLKLSWTDNDSVVELELSNSLDLYDEIGMLKEVVDDAIKSSSNKGVSSMWI